MRFPFAKIDVNERYRDLSPVIAVPMLRFIAATDFCLNHVKRLVE
jgi:hypothetical protein